MLSHVLANKLLDFEMLAKQSPVYSKEHTAVLFSRTGFKIAKNIYILIFWYVCDSVFSQHKCFICGFSSGMYRGTVVHSTQKSDRVSLLNFYKPSFSRGRFLSLHSHTLFMLLLFGSTYVCEQMFSRMKLRKNKISSAVLQTPWELAENASHCHQTLLMLHKSRVTCLTSFTVLLLSFYVFE